MPPKAAVVSLVIAVLGPLACSAPVQDTCTSAGGHCEPASGFESCAGPNEHVQGAGCTNLYDVCCFPNTAASSSDAQAGDATDATGQ
jgi:hypothetical protein